jgi:hypothetical protein
VRWRTARMLLVKAWVLAWESVLEGIWNELVVGELRSEFRGWHRRVHAGAESAPTTRREHSAIGSIRRLLLVLWITLDPATAEVAALVAFRQ